MMRFKVKIDKNDTLYSKIIRFRVSRCARCFQVRDLQCAHIVSRRHYATRFALKPVRNAIPLCASCHEWFDTHKMVDLIFTEKKRVFGPHEEAFTFLVKTRAFTWEDLQILYVRSRLVARYGRVEATIINQELRDELLRLEKEQCGERKI